MIVIIFGGQKFIDRSYKETKAFIRSIST